MKLTQLFCEVDDFCQTFIPAWQENQLTNGDRRRNRAHRMSYSEMITLFSQATEPSSGFIPIMCGNIGDQCFLTC
jgi:hypothetical protein